MSLIQRIPSQDKIGIMADSHGRIRPLLSGLELLKSEKCSVIIHLGDVCDSNLSETTDKCANILKENNVLTVKGNNDHQMVVNNLGYDRGIVTEENLFWLKNLPSAIKMENLFFVHSMPFVKELGLSAMVRSMGKRETELFFSANPEAVLFRGHSHAPNLCYRKRGKIVSEPIPLNTPLKLERHIPSMVTCGALTRNRL